MSLLLGLLACQPGPASRSEPAGDTALTGGGSGGVDAGAEPGGADADTAPGGADADTAPGADAGGTEVLPEAPAPDGLDALFDGEVAELRLRIDEAAWASLTAQSEEAQRVGAEHYDFQYVEGTLTYGGREYGPIGVRIKGQGSFQPIWVKSSLKLKFDRYDEDLRFLDGLNRLTLNNMTNDYAMAHERVAYRLYRAAGVPASRAGHAEVYINGELFGLYTVLEAVDRDLIRSWYGSDDGVLYEGWDVDFQERYVDEYELEFGDDAAGREALAAAAAALEGGEGQEAIDAAAAVIDVDQFLRFWAAEAVIAQFDAYPYSSPGDDYFIYLDPADGRFDFIPWGNDETFYTPDGSVTSVRGLLAQQCLRAPECEARFIEQVWEVLRVAEGLDDGAGWLAWYRGVVDQIQPAVEADRHKAYSNGTVSDYQSSMADFIADRSAAIERLVGAP